MIDLYRKGKRYSDVEDAGVRLTTNQPAHDLKEVLHEALDTLPKIQKAVILLRDYEGYNYEEIAEMTELSLSQVKVYIFRGRQKLKNYIGRLDLVL